MRPRDLVETVYKDKYGASVHYAYQLTRSHEDAEDIVQTAAVKVLQQPDKDITHPWAYWWVAIRNTSTSLHRRSYRSDLNLQNDTTSSRHNTAHEAEVNMRLAGVEKSVEKLTRSERTGIYACFSERILTQSERTGLHRARKKLLEVIG